MNPEDVIQKLESFQRAKFPILSIYLSSTYKKVPYSSYFLSQLHSLVHQKLNTTEQKYWQKDLKKIETYLHGSLDRRNKRSLTFFSAQDNLWQVLDFEFLLPSLVTVLYNPYLQPIKKALKTYQKYLVLLFDREKARLFTVHLGKIEEYKDFLNGEVPQKVKAKKIDWGRDDKIFRHIESHLYHHLKLVSKATKDFIKGKNIHFIIIGSHKDLLAKIKSYLPYPLNRMVLGEFVTELNIPLSKILLRSKRVASRVNQKFTEREMNKKA